MIKKHILILFIIGLSLNLNAQPFLEFGQFPLLNEDHSFILTSELLEKLNWEDLVKFCDSTESHYTDIIQDSLITEYTYTKQGGVARFVIKSFEGKLLSYISNNSDSDQPTKTEYFNKKIWLEYSHKYLQNLPDSLKLTSDKTEEILIAYYELLGVGTRDEYGWICEYSTVGSAPLRRKAVIDLRHEKEILIRLLKYPNTQIQMYVADALIFEDYSDRLWMNEETDLEFKEYLNEKLLTKEEWDDIYKLRDSDKIVKTCGNSGSYKIYESTTKELLSDKAIKEIPENYEMLSDLGYLKIAYKKFK